MPVQVPSQLVCHGCGYAAPATEPTPFRCPRAIAGDRIDHLMVKVLDLSNDALRNDLLENLDRSHGQPFIDFRSFSYTYQTARAAGLTDDDFVARVERLDAAVRRVDGRGFGETPFAPAPDLAAGLGLAAASPLWIKNETGNVSGSHKGRHLMGLALWIDTMRTLGRLPPTAPELAIASCGNAALAAAVVARAADWPLQVFVPPDAHPNVLARLSDLGADLVVCPRGAGEVGDPCFHRFRETIDAGRALPFTCQGSENGLVIDGGETLAYEMVAALRRQGSELDRLFVQVGGGALASSLIAGLRTLVRCGALTALPRIHAVQTTGANPLRRAWRRLSSHLIDRLPDSICSPPMDAAGDARCARHLAVHAGPDLRQEAIQFAATHRDRFMWPWESVPSSLATGILDDETYDWLAIVDGMLATGGWPIVVSEERLADAHRLAHDRTSIPADPTGTAGLAGLAELLDRSLIEPRETCAVLFTGNERQTPPGALQRDRRYLGRL